MGDKRAAAHQHRAGALVFASLIILSAACTDDRPVIEVTVSGPIPLYTQVLEVNATLMPPGGSLVSTLQPQVVADRLDSFLVRLPPDKQGTLVLSVSAVDDKGCQTQQGSTAALAISGPDRYQSTVALTNPVNGCSLTVGTLGDGNGTVSVFRLGALVPAPDGCDASCLYPFTVGDRVTLTAAEGSRDYFAGWSGSCAGTGACVVTIGSGLKTVSASFYPRRVCSYDPPNAWPKTRQGFCWESPLPQGNPLNHMWTFSSQDIWAVGNQGIVLHWNGNFWVPFNSGTSADLYGVWGTSDNDLWIAGNGTLLHYDGTNFTDSGKISGFANLQKGAFLGVAGNGTGDLWLVGKGGVFQHAVLTNKKGPAATLSPMTCDSPMTGDINAIYAWPGAAGGFIAVAAGGVVYTGNGSACKVVSADPGAHDLYGTWIYGGRAWVVGDGTVLSAAATPGDRVGTPWTVEQGDFQGMKLRGVWSGPGGVWVSGDGGAILRRSDQGTFTAVDNSGEASTLRDIRGIDQDDVWAVGDGGALLHGNVAFFLSYKAGGTASLRGVVQDRSGLAWAVGDQGTLLRFGGISLFPVASMTPFDLAAVFAIGTEVWAVGEAGTIVHGIGGVFGPSTSGVTLHLWGIWGAAADNLWAVGDQGTLLHYNGSIWTANNAGSTKRLLSVQGCGPSDVWAVGDAGTLLHYDGSAWKPSPIETALGLRAVWARGAKDVFAVGAKGTLLHYTGTWTPEPSGILQNPPDLNGVFGDTVGCGGTIASSDDVWAVGAGGTLLRRSGTKWSPVRSGVTSDLLGIGGFGKGEFWIVGDNRSALRRSTPTMP